MDSFDLKSLDRLRKTIEEELQWGEILYWKNYDFEKLSERIQAKTGVVLSISTLKRIFGKVNYESFPSVTTLNTLSKFIGYDDWRAFSTCCPEGAVARKSPEEPDMTKKELLVKRNFRLLPMLVLAILVLLSAGFVVLKLMVGKKSHDAYRFSSRTVLTEGLPNSVVFDIDASAAEQGDSVFIAQTWDIRRKFPIDRMDKHHSSIYYYPGYFRAKLMVGDEIVREHDIQIKTKGWLALIEAEWGKEPLYFRQDEIVRSNEILVDEILLEQYKIPTSPELPPLRIYNQKDIHGILTDDFTFETELKTGPATGNNACQRVEVLLQSKNDILIVPLVNPACVGDIYLASYGFYTDSKKENLSGFGCDLNDWVKLRVVCKDKKIRFEVQGKEAFTAMLPNDPTEIVGVQYRFKGTGAVRNTYLEGRAGKRVEFD